jgi:hypothetical protein
VEDEFHFLFKCPLYNKERETVLNEIYKDNQNLLNLSDKNNTYKKENRKIKVITTHILTILHGM